MLSALSSRPRPVTPPHPSLREPTPLPSLSAGLPFLPKPLHCVLIPGHTLRLTHHHSPLSHLPPPASPHSTQCIFLLKLHKIYSSCKYNVEIENAEVQRGPLNASTWLSSLSSCPRSTPHCLWNSQLSTHPSPGSSERRPSPSRLPPSLPMMGPDQDPASSLNTHSAPRAPPSLPGQRPHLPREDYFCPEGGASCLAPDLLQEALKSTCQSFQSVE